MTKFLKVCAAALLGVFLSASVHAAPITINFTGAVDFFNPGPFTQNVPLSGEIVLDDTSTEFVSVALAAARGVRSIYRRGRR